MSQILPIFHYLYSCTIQYFPYSLLGWVVLYLFTRSVLRVVGLYLWALIPFQGRVTQVVRCADGDTIIVGNPKYRRRRDKVRLIGIDTPESLRSLYQDIMPYGKEATQYTRKRLKKGTPIILIYDQDRRDQFGRLLAYVYLMNGEFFNATLVKKGYAFAVSYPPNERHALFFDKLESRARRRRRRLWSIYKSREELRAHYLRSSAYRRFKRRYD